MSKNIMGKSLLIIAVSFVLVAPTQVSFADMKKITKIRVITKAKARVKPVQKRNAKLPLFSHRPKLYFGASVGMSILKPKIKTVGGRVTENQDFASKVYVGYSVTPHVALELSHAVMGRARIHTGTKRATVHYEMTGVSATYSKKLANRINGFTRLGYADLTNKVSPKIPFKQKNGQVVFAGAGLEYIYSNKLSFKGEYEYYGKDAQMFTAGIQWRIK